MISLSKFGNTDVSFVIPSRSNLKYLKWCYASIRKNIGSDIWICLADDASSDNTKEWMEETGKVDPYFKFLINDTGSRLGHTILYDRIVNELVVTPLAIIAHADMFWLPGSIANMLKHIKPSYIVSATRIEPNLHPEGPEKHLIDMGQEPEEFKEDLVLEYARKLEGENKDKITNGVFAPWMFFKEDFTSIGGHDPLFAPQSKEDSDIWNRMLLNGYTFVQARDAFVAHLTCRGSRFNPTLTTPGKNSEEWEKQNARSSRNFIRKWGHFVKHDEFLKPIVPHKYDIGFVVSDISLQSMTLLEPWCSTLYSDDEMGVIEAEYYRLEQPNTKFNLKSKLKVAKYSQPNNQIVVEFDAAKLDQASFNIIVQLPEILTESGEIGTFEVGIFKINIYALDTYEHELINL